MESSRAQHAISPSAVLYNDWYTQYAAMLSHNSKIAGEAAQGSDHSNLLIYRTGIAPTMWESPTHSSVTAGIHTQGRVKDKLIGVVNNQRLELFGTKIAPQVWDIPTRFSVTAGSHTQERVKDKLIEVQSDGTRTRGQGQIEQMTGATESNWKGRLSPVCTLARCPDRTTNLRLS